MALPHDIDRERRYRVVVVGAGVAAGVLAVLCLLGWGLDAPVLYSYGGAYAYTTPLSAILILILGLSTAVGHRPGDTRSRAVATLLAGVAAVLCTAVLMEHLLAMSSGIESWFWVDTATLAGAEHPGRPSVQTTLGMLILAAGAIAVTAGNGRSRRFAAVAGLAAGVIGVLGALGQVVNSTSLYSSAAVGASGLAYPTSVGMILIAAAQMVVAYPHLTTFTASARARVTMTRLLPAVILVPLVTAIAWGTIHATPASATLGSLVAAVGIVVLAVQVWVTARAITDTDRDNLDLVEALPNGTIHVRNNHVVSVNPAVGEILGVSSADLVGRSVDEAFAGPLTDLYTAIHRLRRRADHQAATEIRLTRADGRERIVMVNGRPLQATGHWLYVLQNITDQAHAQERLAAAHAALKDRLSSQEMRLLRYGAVVESSLDAIISKSLNGEILAWNSGAERLYGYPENEALGQSVQMVVPPDRQDEFRDILDRVRRGEPTEALETVRITKSGRRIDVQLTVTPLRAPTGEVVGAAAIARDVTHVHEQEQRFRSVFEASSTALLIVDGAGRVESANREALQMFGYPREEFIGRTVDHLVPTASRGSHADHQRQFLADPQARVMGRGRDLTAVRRDGTEFPVEIGLSPVHLSSGVSVVASVINLSDRVRTQRLLEDKNADLERSNRELQDFAHVASHDLQEPLRMVVNYTELLASRYQGNLDERADRYIGFIIEGGHRMRQLIKGLLVYSRAGSCGLNMRPIDLSQVVSNVLCDLQSSISETGTEIEVGALPVVAADATQLRQVLQNLISNAIKFRGTAAPSIHISSRAEAGEWVISIADNGKGFDQDYSEQIFLMFRRLHGIGEYEGSGIGLAVVRRTMERHGGRVWCESQPGVGTTFHLAFPVAPTAAVPPTESQTEGIAGGETRTYSPV
ncbi:hypothetical protein GCM10012284_46520 [Mangrovihabitans endophyticus]|uniref:histidine kinase n=2 Tax=Mangrovihabitans endophyticus TaxID=1751298 RepID=A0A8J3C1U6_9ACTN|nr:hypothetical protein GCM10012284_46520 [Mangrovihabitans endophyticus]